MSRRSGSVGALGGDSQGDPAQFLYRFSTVSGASQSQCLLAAVEVAAGHFPISHQRW
jgi:hypothetical protein